MWGRCYCFYLWAGFKFLYKVLHGFMKDFDRFSFVSYRAVLRKKVQFTRTENTRDFWFLTILTIALDLSKTCIRIFSVVCTSAFQGRVIHVMEASVLWGGMASASARKDYRFSFFTTCSLDGSTDCLTTQQTGVKCLKGWELSSNTLDRLCAGLEKFSSGLLALWLTAPESLG